MRVWFLAGLILAGIVAKALGLQVFDEGLRATQLGPIALGGLLVGFGTRLGNGCTSGHGVCGISRLSPRSIVATVTFLGTGIVTATLLGRGAGLTP